MIRLRQYKPGDEPVPGYRLTSFLGSGGFGEVWKATAPGGTQVAIKINNLVMKGARKEFRSLKLVMRIQHPHLVPVLAIWLKNERGEILEEQAFEETAMESLRAPAGTVTTDTIEYVPRAEPAELIVAMGLGRRNLADRLEECRKQGLTGIPRDELLKYLHDSARALDYLNSADHGLDSGKGAIQHCDIKPGNILIVADAAQVCDFGLAREVEDARSTSLALSPVYAAPEIIATNIPSPATDQYSLAVTYLELRTGELPFPPGSTAHTIMHAHLNGQLDLSRLPPMEREVIKRATARNPAARYPSSTAMVEALQDACHATPGGTRRRAWLGWATAGAALVLVSGGLVLSGIIGSPYDPSASAPPPLPLPDGFRAESQAGIETVGSWSCPKRIVCSKAGLEIPMLLVNPVGGGGRQIRAFYIMENKVTNDQFAAFARDDPDSVKDGTWKQGGTAGERDIPADAHPHHPVLRVNCIEAAKFACWLGCALPTVNQWDWAAGRFRKDRPQSQDGPFQPGWNENDKRQIAVGRAAEGPIDVGLATHDRSLFGCKDMAGNGREWTSSPQNQIQEFAPCDPDPEMSIVLRGGSYLAPQPFYFSEADAEAEYADERLPDVGFRVVRMFDELR